MDAYGEFNVGRIVVRLEVDCVNGLLLHHRRIHFVRLPLAVVLDQRLHLDTVAHVTDVLERSALGYAESVLHLLDRIFFDLAVFDREFICRRAFDRLRKALVC